MFTATATATRTHQQVAKAVTLRMSQSALDLIAAGHIGAVSQEWVDGIYVNLVATSFTYGVWQVGIPVIGEHLFITADHREATAELARLLEGQSVAW